MRLRPRKRVTVESNPPTRRTLLCHHVREKGDDTPHVCNICLCQMYATDECAPNWVRATCCGEVWHESCISRYAREAESIEHTFKCPQCKHEHHVDDLNDWDADVVIERLFPEDDYSPNEDDVLSSASSEGESDDSENDDSEDERSSNGDQMVKRKTRESSNDKSKRVTRSNRLL